METARAVRDAGLDPEQCYRVRDLSLYKDDIRLYFNDGYLIFAKPVAGERIAAVFTADVEGGDGEILLLPPLRAERKSLARFTGTPNLNEHFRAAVLMFTDSSGRDLLESIERQGSARKAPEMAPLLSEQWAPVVSNILDSFAPRIAGDLLSPGRPDGLLFAAIGGKTLGNFDVVYDPAAAEQILAGQLMERISAWSTISGLVLLHGASARPARLLRPPGFRSPSSGLRRHWTRICACAPPRAPL